MADVTDRACARDGCDELVRRRPRESVRQAAERLHCSLACYRAAVAVEVPTRICEQCGATFGPSRTEPAASFVKRAPRYCSQACNGKAKTARAVAAAGDATRTCARAGCGAALVAHPGESPSALRRRKFCGVACARGQRTGPRKVRARPAVELRQRRARRPRVAAVVPETTAEQKPALTVFGDKAPVQPWRPAGFSSTPRSAP